MALRIIPIVEGHGDVCAVPILVRRIAHQLGVLDIEVKRPIRCPRQKLLKSGELERALDLAVRKGEGNCQILVLIDAEEDCPKDLAPRLIDRAIAARGDIPTAVVLAKMEFEAWFLGALPSLRDPPETPTENVVWFDPESVRGAKERLEELLGAHYAEVIDQPSMAERFDMDLARHSCPSFDKCWRAVAWLAESAAERPDPD